MTQPFVLFLVRSFQKKPKLRQLGHHGLFNILDITPGAFNGFG